MTWNKKNRQFALSCELRPSAILLSQYLCSRSNKYKPTVVLLDLREWNQEVARDRPKGKFATKTAKEAIAQLDELTYGWFTIVKSYTWAIHKVMVRPVDFAQSKKSQLLGKPPKLKRGNPMYPDDHKKRSNEQQQQNISKLDRVFRDIGLIYSRDALARIWRLANKNMDEVVNAIELLLHRHSFGAKKIGNAYGFIISCIEQGLYYTSELYQPADLPVFDSITALVDAVNRIRNPRPPTFDN